MPEVDPKAKEAKDALAALVKFAKTKRSPFALVLKGGSDGLLLISKLKITPPEIAAAKKKLGGSAVIKGFCFGEKEKFVFEVAKLPAPTVGKVVKTVVFRDAGLPIIPEFRLSDSPDLKELDEAEEKPSGTDGKPEAKHGLSDLPERAVSGEGAGQFTTRLKDLKAEIDKAIQGGGEKGQQIKLLASQAAMAAKKQDFAEAERMLDRIEEALNGGGQKTPEPTTNGDPLQQRIQKMEPALLKAVKANPNKGTALMNVWNFAQGKAEAGDTAAATKALDGLEKAIRDALAAAPKTDAERHGIREGIVKERKAELEKFFVARVKEAQAKSATQIGSVEKAIAEQVPDEDAGELAGAIQQEVENLYGEVRDALNKSLNTEDGDQVLRAVETWRKQVADNPLVQHLAKAKGDLGAEADVLDDFEELFDEVAGKVKELVGV
jgi:hypothetical protein